ncbi:hypothetical protein [Kineococcus radiotolerans]|uniref:Lipopolysaccharide biosynthesis protein n=1 Tax=Kineococcus radiotolerans (strain ATCC BAA-149 / DSM 14245 / SRS30216) TaxID=266940 RepID=A6WE96_KINRD|nr:hypothetical protein [Kineococcus radiotolerans]ABS05135.1 hypothetical protein Krad_3672 [Kineococcus radiotolerans SRS30216 = ATCC BAA-149]
MVGNASSWRLLFLALRRFWYIAVLCGVVAGVAASWAVQATAQVVYSASATYIVPTAPAEAMTSHPTTIFDAQRLATSYPVVMENDEQLQGAVAAASGLTPETVKAGLNAEGLSGSNVLRVDFTAGSADEVGRFFPALTQTLGTGATPQIPPGNIELLRSPGEVTEQSGLAPLAPVIGVLAGLVLGLGGAVLLQRLDQRVDSAEDARTLGAAPVVSWSGTPDAAQRLVLSNRVGDAREVLLVDMTKHHPETAEAVAVAMNSRSEEGSTTRWVAGDRPVTADGGSDEALVLADFVVAVVPRRARAGDYQAAVRYLSDIRPTRVVHLFCDARKVRGAVGGPQAAPSADDLGDGGPAGAAAAPSTSGSIRSGRP